MGKFFLPVFRGRGPVARCIMIWLLIVLVGKTSAATTTAPGNSSNPIAPASNSTSIDGSPGVLSDNDTSLDGPTDIGPINGSNRSPGHQQGPGLSGGDSPGQAGAPHGGGRRTNSPPGTTQGPTEGGDTLDKLIIPLAALGGAVVIVLILVLVLCFTFRKGKKEGSQASKGTAESRQGSQGKENSEAPADKPAETEEKPAAPSGSQV